MTLQDTIRTINALRKAVREQQQVITEFRRMNSEQMRLVSTQLQGSSKGYDQRMLSALSATETALNASLASLRRAEDALLRVSQV